MSEPKKPFFHFNAFDRDPDAPEPDWIAGFDPETDVVTPVTKFGDDTVAHKTSREVESEIEAIIGATSWSKRSAT
jgi:hypothetical protein